MSPIFGLAKSAATLAAAAMAAAVAVATAEEAGTVPMGLRWQSSCVLLALFGIRCVLQFS